MWGLFGLLALSACGESPDSGNKSMSDDADLIVQATSNLQNFMNEGKICDVLPMNELKTMFDVTGEVKTWPSEFRQSYTCRYTWEPLDRDAKEAAKIKAMTSDNRGKMTARDRAIDYEVSITLKQTKKSASNFVPAKLTQAQLDQQIEQANQAAAKRLTAEQKELAGDAASEMMTKLLTKNNQNQTIEGVGDAAFWSIVGGGGLNVLDAGVSVFISPLIAEDEAGDLDNAKKIFNQLIK